MISMMFFLGRVSGLESGVVLVQVPIGVEDERWMPVFMYASLS